MPACSYPTRRLHGGQLLRAVIALAAIVSAQFMAAASHAARWDVDTFLNSDGVSFQEVRDVLEDREGGIWIATWGGGVTRILGTHRWKFNEFSGLPSNWVRTLEMDQDGAIWVGTTRGLCRWHGDQLEMFTKERVPEFPNNGIRDIKRLQDQSLWVSFDDANVTLACQKDPTTGEFRWKTVAGDWEVAFIDQTSDGRVWISDANGPGLRSFDGQSWRDVELPQLRSPVRQILENVEESLCILADSSLFKITQDYQVVPIHEFENRVYSAVKSPSGPAYFGTNGKVLVKDPNGWQDLDLDGLYNVRKLLVSRDGSSLWMGTRSGVLRGARFPWQRFRKTTSGQHLTPNVLAVSPDTVPLCMDSTGRILEFRQGNWIAVSRRLALSSAPRMALPDGDDRLWILCDETLYLVGLPRGGILREIHVPQQFIHPSFVQWHPKAQLMRTSTDELRLITESGVYLLRGDEWQRLGPSLDGENGISTVAEAADGSFYVCYRNDGEGRGYVELWKNNRIIRMGRKFPQLNTAQFEAVCVRRNGTVWFGTHGYGVLVFDGSSFRQFTTDHGLASNLVSSIYEASDGSMWVGHRRKGVSNYRDGLWISFGASDGLPSWEIDRFLEDRGGNIWVSIEPRGRWFPESRLGVYRFRPEAHAPDTFIDAYPSKPLSSHGIGVFSFSGVDAWDDTRRDSLYFSWRFVPLGVDQPAPAWSELSSDTSVVTDKAPLETGKYRFEVRSVDAARNVDLTPATTTVTVAAPFWRSASVLVPGLLLAWLACASLLAMVRKHISLRQSNTKLKKESQDRMRAEREQERLRDQLHQSQKLEAVGTLASGIAHDFNNYLTAIVGYTEALRTREIGKDSSSVGAAFLEGIEKATDQAAAITRALQMFSRPENSKKCPHDLNEVVRNALHMLRPTLPASVELVIEIPADEAICVRVNATQIQQVVINLAINSRDAMPNGGILRMSTCKQNGVAVFSIEDSGMGIRKTDQKRIFEPFFTTKARGQGTGLGLSIVHGIVTDHHGHVRVASPGKDKGTQISVELPICNERGLEEAKAEISPTERGNGETILIAEDHVGIRTIMQEFFHHAAYDVLEASDGAEVLRLFREHQETVQLMILDIDLPRMSGTDCLNSIQETYGEVPTILISGMSDVPAIARHSDHVMFVRKPFSMAKLSGMVRQLVPATPESTCS